MKKTKIISFFVILLAVVALGVFMGNIMFNLLEGGKSSQNTNTPSASSGTENKQGTVKILYGDSDTPQNNEATEFQQNLNYASSANAIPLHNQSESSEKLVTASNTPKTTNENLVFSPTGPRWFAYASTNGLNVRETPDKKGKFMFKVAKGTRGVVKEKKDGWTYIQWDFNKKKGWSIDDYLVQGPANIIENLVNKNTDTKIENIKTEQLTQANIEKEIEQSKTIIGVARPASLTETVMTYTNGKDLPQKATIAAPNVANIREQPTTKSLLLIKLPKGTVVGVKGVKQVDKYQWFEITFSNGTKSGWTREDNLKF